MDDDAKPRAGISDGINWDGAFIRAQAVINDGNDSGFTGSGSSANDVQRANLKPQPSWLEIDVPWPNNDFFDLKEHVKTPLSRQSRFHA